jgi:hypothetical protein
MPLIRNKQKARQFIDAIEEPLTMRRTRVSNGEMEIEIVIVEPTDDLAAIVAAATKNGFIVRFDGQRIVIEEPPTNPLPQEVTREVTL